MSQSRLFKHRIAAVPVQIHRLLDVVRFVGFDFLSIFVFRCAWLEPICFSCVLLRFTSLIIVVCLQLRRSKPAKCAQLWNARLISNYSVSQKTVQICFCQNFVNFPPILIIVDRKMAKRLKLCEMHSFSISPNSCHHTSVLNADVPNC